MLAECLRAAGGRDGDVDLVSVGEGFLRARLYGVDDEQRPLWYPEDQILAGSDGPDAGLDLGTFAAREHALLDAWTSASSALPRA